MEKHGNKGKQRSLFYTAALLAPVTHSASVSSWGTVLAMAAPAILLRRYTRWGSGWILMVQKFWAAGMAGVFLQWSECYWQSLPMGFITPLVLLALVPFAINTRGKAAKIGCVLLWPLLLLLGSVLLSGVSEIQGEYLKPEWTEWNLGLLAVLLIPVDQGKESEWKIPLLAVAVSAITTGVLSNRVSTKVCSGIYELSRSLSLLGIAERFESLIAAAMTLGFFCALSYLLEKKDEKEPIWGMAVIAALIYLTKLLIPGWLLVIGSALCWLLLPAVFGEK